MPLTPSEECQAADREPVCRRARPRPGASLRSPLRAPAAAWTRPPRGRFTPLRSAAGLAIGHATSSRLCEKKASARGSTHQGKLDPLADPFSSRYFRLSRERQHSLSCAHVLGRQRFSEVRNVFASFSRGAFRRTVRGRADRGAGRSDPPVWDEWLPRARPRGSLLPARIRSETCATPGLFSR